MEYLFDKWNDVQEKIGGRPLFIFLDFDGTLAPIVERPEAASLPAETKELLRELSAEPRFKLAFISGRSLADIKEKIGLQNVIYSGNHGLEIEGPRIKFEPLVSAGYKTLIRSIKSELAKGSAAIKGALLEDKGLSLSLHYRLVAPRQLSALRRIFRDAILPHRLKGKIMVNRGKKVFEVRPAMEWDKGKIVLWLLARESFAAKDGGIVPVYAGDDLTDEDAFRALKRKGLTILVGNSRPSAAGYYVRDHSEMRRFLKMLLEDR
ncbi:MAG: trehalose-phosphatase [Candidatus Omnitrophota bacterium]